MKFHPINFLRHLSGNVRTTRINQLLSAVFAFIAGAINAGGFLAVHQYTSHMTGFVSAISDNIILGNMLMVAGGIVSLLSFLSGAAVSAIMVNWARHRALRSEYAGVIAAESILLLFFGLLGANLNTYLDITVPLTVITLCFIMGLQNALMTKMSRAEIRTTHLTGVITDLGIELGKMLYWNQHYKHGTKGYVSSKRTKLLLCLILIFMFFSGGIIGALGFKYIGYSTVLPLAFVLFLIGLVPIIDDVVAFKHESNIEI